MKAQGCSQNKVLYGENFVLPIDILTDGIPEEKSVEIEGDVSGLVSSTAV